MNLIDGVILLNTVVVDASTLLKVICCILGVFCICSIVFAIIGACKHCLSITLTYSGVAICCMILSLAASSQMKVYPYTEYQVTIDDSVSLNEFYETYEVLDHEGKIWTIREKTND